MTSNNLSKVDGTAALLDAATADPNATLSVDGSALVASNLSATSVSGGSGVTATYAAVSDATLEWIAAFTSASMSYAATLDPSDNARRYLLGTPRTVDQMEHWTMTWASEHGRIAITFQLQANFGRYGSLPLIGSYLTDPTSGESALVLIDALTGQVDGPFESSAPFSASAFLAAHANSYVPGTGYSLTRADTGCPSFAAPYPPPAPWPTLPTWPGILPGHWILQPPLAPLLPPGRPTAWACTTIAGVGGVGACTCTRTVTWTIGNIDPNHPPTIPIRIPEVQTCTTPGPCTGTTPAAAPALPAGCGSTFWY